jgi:hypothetical protein
MSSQKDQKIRKLGEQEETGVSFVLGRASLSSGGMRLEAWGSPMRTGTGATETQGRAIR